MPRPVSVTLTASQASTTPSRHLNGSGRRELDGVAHEIEQDLLHPVFVRLDQRHAGVDPVE